ncbi:hypothetical protein BIZ83_gp053 [Erwinia phage vB_EamM_ChrisDB]|uniref:hypothetical protein n=1 Tax=Erwinia phage vB_EamM_ChrisDB TaxID=1883371 RepID=UPI00081CDDB6|nr:hypothetical protein BIZ83_gp053 [Erwinia phage vB_EamM_ChrisDB]ANZ48800.1 hypothetical protein CHRISDB_238 [Erwinia phage vB_EamM_ChrisDB]QVW55723.1 hypothetical protein pEaSNUABM9_00142 [Erwinia phage pEa_SNUABM_9]
MELKMFTRSLRGKVEPEIYTTPIKKNPDNSQLVVGTIKDITAQSDGRRLVTIEIDDRNKNRFRNLEGEQWVENHFEVWHGRRLLLPIKKR